MFRVQLANGHIVLGHISGKLRKHYIKIAAGDRVKMEMSPYDTDKARITFPSKKARRPIARRCAAVIEQPVRLYCAVSKSPDLSFLKFSIRWKARMGSSCGN